MIDFERRSERKSPQIRENLRFSRNFVKKYGNAENQTGIDIFHEITEKCRLLSEFDRFRDFWRLFKEGTTRKIVNIREKSFLNFEVRKNRRTTSKMNANNQGS